MSRLARDPHVEQLVCAYRADLEAAGMFAENEVTSPARSFLLRVGVDGWSKMTLDQQLAVWGHDRRLLAWLIVTGRVFPTADYLVASKLRVGKVAAGVYREFHGRFVQVAAGLGFDPKSAELQWWAVAKVAALAGVSPERLTKAQLDTGREQLIAATRQLHPDHPMRARPVTTRLHGAEATLFHAGVIDVPPRKRHWNKSADRAREWAAIPPRLRATFEGYIEQMRLSLRPATMVRVEAVLREFASWLTTEAPEVAAVRDLRRAHIERYKRHLARRPSVRGGRLSNIGLAEQLGTLRVCLDRLSEWDGEDVPTRVLMFAGDIPRRDQPLPRFIDDAAAAKLLRAAREHPDPFTRLAVEFLARTGLRKSEFLDLTVDSVVQIGSAYWLHVPLGKLRTDRYIPLHPQLKEMLDEWVADRPAGSARAVPVHRARPPDRQATRRGRGQQRRSQCRDRARDPAPAPAHTRDPGDQPRHVPRSDRRAPRAQVDADDDGLRQDRQPHRRRGILQRVREGRSALRRAKELPATAEGAEMRKLRAEMHRRMLGNGYCARPVGLDCHFESICESCTYFQTTLEFRPTLQRQRDDAAEKGQVGRQKIFDGLLARLEAQAS